MNIRLHSSARAHMNVACVSVEVHADPDQHLGREEFHHHLPHSHGHGQALHGQIQLDDGLVSRQGYMYTVRLSKK